jgi:hypothetical protein
VAEKTVDLESLTKSNEKAATAVAKTIDAVEGLGARSRATTRDVITLAGGLASAAKSAQGLPSSYAQINVGARLAEQAVRSVTISYGDYAVAGKGALASLDAVAQKQATATSAARLQAAEVQKLGGVAVKVFSSLASGGNPFAAMIQEAPALVEVLMTAASQGVGLQGAVAGVAAELGGVVAAVGPLGLVAGAFVVVGAALVEGHKEAERYQNILIATGNAAGVTSADLQGMGEAVARSTNTSFGQAREVMMQLAGSGRFVGEQIGQVGDVSVRLAELTGQSAISFAGDFSKMGEDVAGFARNFNSHYHLLSAAQLNHIRLIQEEGDVSGATTAFITAAQDRLAERGVADLGVLEKAWRGVGTAISGAWEDLKKFGAGGDVGLQAKIKALNGEIEAGSRGRNPLMPEAMNRLVGQRDEMQRVLDAHKASAGADSRNADTQQRGAEAADRLSNRWLLGASALARYNKELKAYDNDVRAVAEAKLKTPDLAEQKLVRDAIRQRNLPATSASSSSHGSAPKAEYHGDDAVRAAKSAELAAQLGVTKDIETIAGLKRAQIEQELQGQRARTESQAKNNEINKTDAQAALSHYEAAAKAKRQALDLETANEIANRDLQQRQELLGYTQRLGVLSAASAKTVEDANAFETANLRSQQAADADALAEKLKQRVTSHEITAERASELLRAQKAVQDADVDAQAREQRRRIAQRDLAIAQAGYQNQADVLQSQKGLAQSAYEAAQLDRKIAEVRYDAERDSLQRTVANTDLKNEERDLARNRLNTLEQTHANEMKALERSASMVSAYGEVVQALAGLAGSIQQGDVGGSISGFSNVLKQISGLAGQDSSLGKALGGAASFLGPVGAAVSAVTGVLGAIGQRSAEKAQAKLAALNKGVEDLRAANMASSNSLAGALEQANSTSNTDLGYSNAMLVSLRSIDSRIGTVANAIARSIKTGDLLDTSGLGLGTTVAGPSTLTKLLSPLSWVLPGLFGSKTKTELLDQGLVFNPTTYGALANGGVTGQTYADLVSTTTKKLLGVTTGVKVRTSTVYGGVDGDLMGQITGVIEALGEGVVTAATTFGQAAGQAAQDALAGATIDLGKLSLKDLKPDEIEAAINAMFDKVADDLASAGVPALKDLAKVGEGAFETLTRLATEYKTIDAALASVGMAFKTGGLGSLEARKGLLDKFGGLDAFTSQTAFFGEHFLTEDDRLKPLKASVATTLTAMGQPADLSREGFKKFVQGQDLSTEDGAALYAALMALAPAFDKVATAAETAKAAIDDQRTSIQDQIDELTKSPAELLAKSRDKEREAVKALDLSLVPLLENLWKLQDAAEAAKLATDRSNAEADMLDAQGFTEQAKAKRRNLALADVKDPDQRTYMQRTWAAEDAAAKVSAARDVLTQAYHDEQDEILKTKDKFKELSDSLKAFSASLSDTIAGADLATRYRTTRQAFQATASLARTGNEDALRRLQAEGEAFTSASRDYASTSIDYLRDVGLVRSAVDDAADAADNQVSIADQQLLTLKESLKGLIDVKDGVISVRDAIANLQGALVEARAAGVGSVGGSNLGLTPTNTSSPSPTVQRDPTLANANMAWLLTHGMLAAANDTKPDDVTKAYIALGNTYKPGYMDIVNTQGINAANALVDAGKLSVLQGGSLNFATGGGFEVGGSGPPDSKLFNLALSPGEAVNVQRADQKGDRSLITELRRLREELADLRETSVRIANSNDKMERTLTNVTEGGRAMMTEAAA